MASCCYGDEYEERFTEQRAERTARSFRRRGLSGSAAQLTDAVIGRGIEGATVLEVGGGIGHLHLRLLEAGAGRAVNIELSPGWEIAARELVSDLGLEDRVDRRIGDVVDETDELPEADVVVLHRVVCCYPNWAAMIDAAASRSRRMLAITMPLDRWWTRAVVTVTNAPLRLRGRAFRAFVHPVEGVLDRLDTAGFRVTHDEQGLVWRTLVLERAS